MFAFALEKLRARRKRARHFHRIRYAQFLFFSGWNQRYTIYISSSSSIISAAVYRKQIGNPSTRCTRCQAYFRSCNEFSSHDRAPNKNRQMREEQQQQKKKRTNGVCVLILIVWNTKSENCKHFFSLSLFLCRVSWWDPLVSRTNSFELDTQTNGHWSRPNWNWNYEASFDGSHWRALPRSSSLPRTSEGICAIRTFGPCHNIHLIFQ